MTDSLRHTRATGGEFGNLMRYWRDQRRMSQLELALNAGVSQRHISFVESGRSRPSRELVLLLAETLDVPLRERNLLALAAGFAPAYGETAWDAPEMAMVKGAMDRVLEQQEPYPAMVLDRYWNVLRANTAAPRLFNQFVDLAARKQPRNLLDLMLDPAGMRPFVEDWPRVARSLLQRVRRETVGHVLDAETAALLRRLQAYPDVAELRRTDDGQLPIIPITFRKGEVRLSYFSLISTVGLPQDVTAQEFRIECMFPVDTGVSRR